MVLAETPKRLERYLKPQIQGSAPLPLERSKEAQSRANLEEARLKATAELGPEIVPPTPLPKPPPVPADTVRPLVVDLIPANEPLSPEALLERLRPLAPEAAAKAYAKRQLTVIGTPVTGGYDPVSVMVLFGNVKCVFGRKEFEDIRAVLNTSQIRRQPVTVAGTFDEITRQGVLVLRDCGLVAPAAP